MNDVVESSLLKTVQKVAKFIKPVKQSLNDRHFVLRVFALGNATEGLTAITNTLYQDQLIISSLFESFYFFTLRVNDQEGRTHGVFATLKGFLSRDRTDTFFMQLITHLAATGGGVSKILGVTPRQPRHQSNFDYVNTLYGQSMNLHYKYAAISDMVTENVVSCNTEQMNKMLRRVRGEMYQILDNMISMPALYEQCLLHQLLKYSREQFIAYMRFTTFYEMVQNVCNDAYNLALMKVNIPQSKLQLMTDYATRFNITGQGINEKTQKQLQRLFQSHFDTSFIHPSPFVKIHQNQQIGNKGVFDAIYFDYQFTFLLMLVGRWFAKVCMQNKDNVSNNHANLVLYGQSGAGKSLILSALQHCVPTYTYLTQGHFQNPDILSSAFVYFGEFQSLLLVQSHYKDLFDVKSSVKVDFKNLHPENVTQDVPIILSTNDDVLTLLQQLPYRRMSLFNTCATPVNSHSVDAALRRLYLVPCRFGKYDFIHRDVKENEPYFEELRQFNRRFEKEEHKLERIFNFIVAFSLFQRNQPTMDVPSKLQGYFHGISDSFIKTYFGQFYYKYLHDIDTILNDYEVAMVQPGINDTELGLRASNCVGRFGQLMSIWTAYNSQQFYADQSQQAMVDEQGIYPAGSVLTLQQLSHVSQPVRMYYLDQMDPRFQKVKSSPVTFNLLLHPTVYAVLNDTTHSLYEVDHAVLRDGLPESLAPVVNPAAGNQLRLQSDLQKPYWEEPTFGEISENMGCVPHQSGKFFHTISDADDENDGDSEMSIGTALDKAVSASSHARSVVKFNKGPKGRAKKRLDEIIKSQGRISELEEEKQQE